MTRGRVAIATALLLATGMLFPAPAGAAAPGLVLQPTMGPPNSTVSFHGSGFCATSSCGVVTVTFNNAPVAYPVHVHADGTITGAFYVPSGPNGWQRVVAMQPGASRSATALYFVGTSLPAQTGPQPTVNYQPPRVTPRATHHTVPATPVTTPKTSAPHSATSAPSSAVPSSGTPGAPSVSSSAGAVAGSGSAHTSSSTWWWVALALALLVAAGGGAVVVLRRRSH